MADASDFFCSSLSRCCLFIISAKENAKSRLWFSNAVGSSGFFSGGRAVFLTTVIGLCADSFFSATGCAAEVGFFAAGFGFAAAGFLGAGLDAGFGAGFFAAGFFAAGFGAGFFAAGFFAVGFFATGFAAGFFVFLLIGFFSLADC